MLPSNFVRKAKQQQRQQYQSDTSLFCTTTIH